MTSILDLLPELRRVASTDGGEYAGPCPWCAGKDQFRCWPTPSSGRARWWCRRCARRGDVIDLLRELKGMSFREAAGAVGQPVGEGGHGTPRRPLTRPLSPPCAAWQSKVENLAIEAEAALWASEGAHALSYLRQRGFVEKVIRAARLGYVPADRREPPGAWGLPADHARVWTPRGIAIPWRACGAIWRLNIRRLAGIPKYIGPAGCRNGLYGADGLHSGRPAILVEGEFDALAVAQEAGDLVVAVAAGSTCGARHPIWVRRLEAAPFALVAFDDDDAGSTAAGWWLDTLPRARRWAPEGAPGVALEAGVKEMGYGRDRSC